MPPATPETLARQQIDAHLVATGWVIHNLTDASPGITLRKVPLKTNPYDASLCSLVSIRLSASGPSTNP